MAQGKMGTLVSGESLIPKKVVFEYENRDLQPAYVEGAMGYVTGKGSLQVSFFSENLKIKSEDQGRLERLEHPQAQSGFTVDVKESSRGPFVTEDQTLCITRRVQANLILTLPALKAVLSWLQARAAEMETRASK